MRASQCSEGVKALSRLSRNQVLFQSQYKRRFHLSPRLDVVRPFLLADIGEGIREVQIIQWFVKPGARVEQFDPICEVQSDKASVEITSRFDGIIKKLHYEADDTAVVGKPLVDIDIQSEIKPEDEAVTTAPVNEGSNSSSSSVPTATKEPSIPQQSHSQGQSGSTEVVDIKSVQSHNKHASLSTPAVRHLSKELKVDIAEIQGTGKDGRVLKEDVQRYASSRSGAPTASTLSQIPSHPSQGDSTVPLSPTQAGMFKTMTRSLSIPHFLYTNAVDMSACTRLRQALTSDIHTSSSDPAQQTSKVTPLPLILKAVSLALQDYPLINAHLDTSDASKPTMTYKSSHDFGIAVDTPSGLLVPVLRGVQNHTIFSLATEITRLSQLAQNSQLAPSDFSGATFTVSNVGSIGGGVVAPVIVAPQVAILGVGRARIVPGFDEEGNVVKKEEAVLSWSADHRVVDGAMVARCAEKVRAYLQEPGRMFGKMR
ncbi:MAG: hypothetical protein M1820_000605 [Bogoriella megaspora]|nr:MAG: hypothetical protein M1820_000605 [Bogoriella megaspora]